MAFDKTIYLATYQIIQSSGKTLISSSRGMTWNPVTSTLYATNFSGSFVGTIASASFATSASYATTASYALNGGGGGTTTGSFTGSFTGSLYGTASYALTTSTASYVLQATSASYATTASYAMNGGGGGTTTGSFTGSFTGSLLGTASWANNASLVESFPAQFDGQGGVIAANTKTTFIIPYDFNITGWTLFDVSNPPITSSITLDVWKNTYANYPPTSSDTIFGTKPSLSASMKNTATGLNITSSAYDEFIVNVDSVTGSLNVKLFLFGTRR